MYEAIAIRETGQSSSSSGGSNSGGDIFNHYDPINSGTNPAPVNPLPSSPDYLPGISPAIDYAPPYPSMTERDRGFEISEPVEFVHDWMSWTGTGISVLNRLFYGAPAPWIGPAFNLGGTAIEGLVYGAEGRSPQLIDTGAQAALVVAGGVLGGPYGSIGGNLAYLGARWIGNELASSEAVNRAMDSYLADNPRGSFGGFLADSLKSPLIGAGEWLRNGASELHNGVSDALGY